MKSLTKRFLELVNEKQRSVRLVFTIKYTRNGTHFQNTYQLIDMPNNINSKIAECCMFLGHDAVIDSITLDGVKDE